METLKLFGRDGGRRVLEAATFYFGLAGVILQATGRSTPSRRSRPRQLQQASAGSNHLGEKSGQKAAHEANP